MNYFALLAQKIIMLETMLIIWVSDIPLLREAAEDALKEYALALKKSRGGLKNTKEEPVPDEFVKFFEERKS